MNPAPYPFEDFLRAKQSLLNALIEHPEPFALLTGDTGSAPIFADGNRSAV